MYAFNIREQVKRLLHPKYRKSKLIAFIYGLLTPIRRYMYTFKEFERSTEITLQYGRQLGSMEMYFNYIFGSAPGTIYIINVVPVDPIYMGWENEAGAEFYIGWENENELPAIYMGWENEFAPVNMVDFVVNYPSSMTAAQVVQLKKHVEDLRLVTRRYCLMPY